MRFLLLLSLILVGCAAQAQPLPKREIPELNGLAFRCGVNARLAGQKVANVTTATTVAELVSWIKIDQQAWSEMKSDIEVCGE